MSKKIILSPSAEEIATKRYFSDGEDWECCVHRVARAASEIESDKVKYTNEFFDIIYNMYFLPGGRILRNAGKLRGSMFNCYNVPIGDSIEEIGQHLKDSLILWSAGGGVGSNFSKLRPVGAPILGKGGKSSGLVSFLKAADSVASTIESGGQRRAAGLALVDINHPEVLDYIDCKLVHGEISHYNLSVGVTNEFMQAVEANTNWIFKFKQKEYGSMPALDIWNKIVGNMINSAEPGLINWDNLTKNNSYYYDPVTCTNPCGETALENYGICCLSSLVLPNFITGNINTNWKKLEETIKLAVRFLDNVIDINKYALKEVDIQAHKSRRIGLGIMGLAEYLFAKKLRYGSERANAEVEKLMRFIRDATYMASIELAEEKGSFPAFEPIPYVKASFIRKLPAQIRMSIKKHGIRNVTCLAIAPTGTISLLAEVSSGIEPLFSKAYSRNDRVSSRTYVHPKLKEIIKTGEEIPEWFVDSYDLNPVDHFEVQALVQKYVDGAVSKTINLPKGTTPNQLSELLIEYIKDLKGVTCYVDGSRDGQVLNSIKIEDLKNVIEKEDIEEFKTERDVKCANGVCSI